MDASTNDYILKNGLSMSEQNNYSNSTPLDFISSTDSLNNEKLLEICSRRRSNSLLNQQLLLDSNDSQLNFTKTSLGHNFQHSPNLSIPHCPTSFSPLPRFPPPSSVNRDLFNSGLETTCILQPRVNPISRRTRHFVPNERKDEYYWQKRKKNNEAARKSREKRRTIDSVLEEKVLILTHENKLLRKELHDLKAKYSEIDGEKTGKKCKTAHENKVQSSKSAPSPPNNHTNNGETRCSCSQPPAPSATSTSSSPTTITLPKLNVILESEKMSSENASSAKLVLSNLASGTLILSPINLISKIKGNDEIQVLSRDGLKLANTSLVLNTSNKYEDLKEVEAANTLANLFRSADDVFDGNSNDGDQKMSNNGLGCDSCQQSPKETKKIQNLPCKLRFKCSQPSVVAEQN